MLLLCFEKYFFFKLLVEQVFEARAFKINVIEQYMYSWLNGLKKYDDKCMQNPVKKQKQKTES